MTDPDGPSGRTPLLISPDIGAEVDPTHPDTLVGLAGCVGSFDLGALVRSAATAILRDLAIVESSQPPDDWAHDLAAVAAHVRRYVQVAEHERREREDLEARFVTRLDERVRDATEAIEAELAEVRDAAAAIESERDELYALIQRMK